MEDKTQHEKRAPPAIDDFPSSSADIKDRSFSQTIQAQTAALNFPSHWDAYLQLRTQQIFKLGAWQPYFFDVAVRNATLYLETRIRQLCDAQADLMGVKLMEYAFNPDSPRGPLLTESILSAEAQGLQALFRGAILQIRNPLGHRDVNMTQEAFDSIAFVNYLLRTANNLALDKYVYPFLPSRDKFRAIQLTKRLDIDGDGNKEFIILISERDWSESSGGAGRVLAVRSDFSSAIPGNLPLIDGVYHSPHITSGDLDGDGRLEFIVSFIGETDWRVCLIVDYLEGQLRGTSEVDGQPIRSYIWPPEVVIPMATAPEARVITYDEHGRSHFIRYEGGVLAAE